MSTSLSNKYPHLQFRRHWELTANIMFLLGQCESLVNAIGNTPILPHHHQKLLGVSLIKGAQATTAIEGNTLTEDEILDIYNGKRLPPSKEYQEIEVKNVLEALNELLNEIVQEDHIYKITPDLIKRYHRLIGMNLGKHFEAVPGKFREDNRIVGEYRCPDYTDIDALINIFCNWLYDEFHYDTGQEFYEIVIEAIIAHVYLEWIHPFGDGNGRTGRLLEFYILLRGGNPDIASHILSNHYNLTRSEYYRQLKNATRKGDLTEFIGYALLGFRDGLQQTLDTVQKSQFEITWQKHIYDKFSNEKITNRSLFKRRRQLMLDMPTDKAVSLEEIKIINPRIARQYAIVSDRTILRDLVELINMDLIEKDIDKRYRANFRLIKIYIARRKKKIEKY